MLLSNFGVYSVSIDHNGIHNNVDPSIEFSGKLSSLKDSGDLKISKIFHCEGLILCTTKGNTRLVIWNSSTGETQRIKPKTRYRYEDYYALGYINSKSSGHSLKILRSCCYENGQEQWVAEFEIYEFSSDSWRVLDYFTRDYGVFCSDRSLKGNTYWVAGDKETGMFMLYFDFTTERFGRFPLPFTSFNPEDTASLSVVREEKLSVLHQKILDFSNEMKIWLTNKISETIELSWSNFVLTVDYDKFDLPSVVNVTSFLLDEENKVAVCSDIDMDDEDRTRVYVVGEDIYKQVYKDTTKTSYFNWPLLINYVPSLVHIKKNTLKRQKKRKSREVR
ncbi:F-box associated interaction domain [Arabidopsis thaliana x Arabidopsis arenosa]|uniref:F-box associated interaction domain n=1 Tax=Arabidopsis thaliana x Arabidopsis arenosa TaxID=1240361 RepID=A0A8T2A4I9_9BRAS|nr:F-box associated interaction domain [Arabidopsis thaliana x Arabidopsis arenosa]